MNKLTEQIQAEVNKVVLGKEDIVRKVLLAILAQGHVLLEDVPGVGKTTLAKAFSKTLGLDSRRVQFTSDTLPSDIIGFSVFDNGVFPKVDTAFVHDLLHLKGHEYREAFRGQSAEGVEFPGANGQDCIQTVHLLIFEDGHLAHPLPGSGENGIRIRVQLVLCVGGNDHGQDAEDHPLVTGG